MPSVVRVRMSNSVRTRSFGSVGYISFQEHHVTCNTNELNNDNGYTNDIA